MPCKVSLQLPSPSPFGQCCWESLVFPPSFCMQLPANTSKHALLLNTKTHVRVRACVPFMPCFLHVAMHLEDHSTLAGKLQLLLNQATTDRSSGNLQWSLSNNTVLMPTAISPTWEPIWMKDSQKRIIGSMAACIFNFDRHCQSALFKGHLGWATGPSLTGEWASRLLHGTAHGVSQCLLFVHTWQAKIAPWSYFNTVIMKEVERLTFPMNHLLLFFGELGMVIFYGTLLFFVSISRSSLGIKEARPTLW